MGCGVLAESSTSTARRLIPATLCTIAGLLALGSAPALAVTTYVPVASFGSGGASPSGMAVDQTSGEVFVADESSVQRFTPVDRSSPSAGYSQGSPLAGSFTNAVGVAVDDSGGLSQGDVYVADAGAGMVDKFEASGSPDLTTPHIGAGATPLALSEPRGVAVDPANGDVYVSDATNNVVDVYEPSGVFLTQFSTGSEPRGLAFNSSGSDLYVLANGLEEVEEFDASGKPVEQTAGPNKGKNIVDSSEHPRAIAVNPATNDVDVYQTNNATVAVFESSGAPLSPPGFLAGEGFSLGLAVDGLSGAIYVPEFFKGVVSVFQLVTLPEVTTGGIEPVTETSAVFNGTVNPDGVQVTSCGFEYGTSISYEHTAPCSVLPGEGKAPVAVQANVEGLQPNTVYHYRLTAASAEDTKDGVDGAGQDKTFQLSKPIIDSESASEVGFTTAIVNAEINAVGSPTEYHFEYGTTAAYGRKTQPASLGASQGDAGASVQLGELKPDTLYHFRVVAKNAVGTTLGGDITFTTFPTSVTTLPDGRLFEMVTPVANQDANVYVPYPPGGIVPESSATQTERPFQASAAGDVIAYLGDPTSGGNGSSGGGGGNEYLATRAPAGGWGQVDIEPPGYNHAVYQAFSSDLSAGILGSSDEPPLSVGAPGGGYEVLYATGLPPANSSYHALFTATHLNRSAEEFGTANVGGGSLRALTYAGASADLSHMLFEANDALLEGEGKLETELNEDVKNEVKEGKNGNNLYDSVGGRLSLINVLPNGKADVNASFGAPPPGPNDPPDFSNVISTDGSRIFWTDLNTGDLYVRENGTSTIQVSVGAADFWTATPDGRYVFYTEGEKLWRFDVEGKAGEVREELAGAGAGVRGMVGVGINERGEDGAYYAYFVANGVLTSKENGEKETAREHEPNLYLRHDGETAFIATLSPEDISKETSGGSSFGDLQPGLGHRTAEVTPDGRHIVFMSHRSLTGYPNIGAEGPMTEVFVYSADANKLFCASCNPSGEPPSLTKNTAAAYLPVNYSNTRQPQWISEDGSRVFFDSTEPLVPTDTNGRQDVYEWEQEGVGGVGGCPPGSPNGCVYLLSGGISTDASYLIGSSASGNDVFIVTRAQLVPQDQNDNFNLFDVRVGGVQPLSSPACSGTGCQGVPPAPPIFATPASATFNGVGNFAPPLKSAVKPLTRAQKLTKALKACKKKQQRKKRDSCEARARERYGAKSKAKQTAKRGGK
jgi:DNA-binding beta-propeller fold protein YncE